MYQEAINTLVGLSNRFPEVYKIGVIEKDCIILYWTDEDHHEKEFKSAQQMIKWIENNLKENN